MALPEAPYKIEDDYGERVLKINFDKQPRTPSVESDAYIMAHLISILQKIGTVNKIKFTQREDFVYDENQTQMLVEISNLINEFLKNKILSPEMLGATQKCTRCYSSRFDLLNVILLYELREDPIGAYLHINHEISKEQSGVSVCATCGKDNKQFLKTLEYIQVALEKTKLIKAVKPFLDEYKIGERTIYGRIFKPRIKPNFLYTKVVTAIPAGATELESYNVGNTKVIILKLKDEIRPMYHIVPPEFILTEQKYMLLGEAREVIASHKPTRSEFIDPEKTREVFASVERDLLRDLTSSKGITLKDEEIEELVQILTRHTIGFGASEVLLSDPKVQDLAVNAPVGINAATIIHQDYGECVTNLSITPREAEGWATKLRLVSGRPFDEANPVLDTELLLPGSRIRVAAIQEPLSPKGYAFAFRRHREKPWTLPLFIKNRMINEQAAGLLSFLIDGSRTMIIAGTRSSGKTSLLGSMMVEIMRANRVIVVEDTLELPIAELKKLNYDVQSMKVRSVITGEKAGITAAEGIRTALRMGDSALIVGEVRSKEAIALYEAMRVGALANVVAGTIHGDSPYGVFDRVVNDLGVPKTSFKATDIIVICNPVKSASGLESERRVVQITEVRKQWTDDPLIEKAFVDLMVYNAKTDELEPTDALIQGESEVVKAVASRIKEWAGDWDAVWNNIQLRAKTKKTLIELSETLKKPEILEADFVVEANDQLHYLSEKVKKKIGASDPDKIFHEWEFWLKRKTKEL